MPEEGVPVQFVVTPVDRGADHVLQVAGELDIATARELQAAVGKALAEQPDRLLVDLSGARFIDSAGCRELVRTVKAGAAAAVPVEVVAPPDNWRVRRVLDFVQLASIAPVRDEPPAP